MDTSHRTLHLAGHTLHRIDFDPTTLTPGDLLWLPHHAQLSRFARKRQAEHLAGRIAAVHALRQFGETSVPGMGDARQPLWPAGLYGSITHSANSALAVVAEQPVGVDLEALFTPQLSIELADSIISPAERAVIAGSTLDFALALTLVFSAKESLYKAFSHLAHPLPGFASAQLTALTERTLTLRPQAEFSATLNKEICVYWQNDAQRVITLAGESW